MFKHGEEYGRIQSPKNYGNDNCMKSYKTPILLEDKMFCHSCVLFIDDSSNYAWVFISGKCYKIKVSYYIKSKISITTYMYIFYIYVSVFGIRKAMLQNLRLECNTETRAHSLSFLSPYCM